MKNVELEIKFGFENNTSINMIRLTSVVETYDVCNDQSILPTIQRNDLQRQGPSVIKWIRTPITLPGLILVLP
jgi:hypothetical protein